LPAGSLYTTDYYFLGKFSADFGRLLLTSYFMAVPFLAVFCLSSDYMPTPIGKSPPLVVILVTLKVSDYFLTKAFGYSTRPILFTGVTNLDISGVTITLGFKSIFNLSS
jgi:hypothetical protein